MEKAIFAAGCFWGVEAAFRQVPGVIEAISGYTGGTAAHPTYKEVCANRTGHAEAVEVEFDPARVSYPALLRVFWENHDPTTLNRQGPDVGTQYRSAIFYLSPEQAVAAQSSKAELERSRRFSRPIVTEITAAGPFYRAEDYHQRYLEKHGQAACHIPAR
ncbi:MAG: peptide-methionine (S)-S-oxide reductase MsrA [Terriglobales bacterium]